MTEPSKDESLKKHAELTDQMKKKAMNMIIFGIFQAVQLHVTALQSDVVLFNRALKGNEGAVSRTLALTNAVSGVAGLFLNQIGGKLSDSLGRKPFFLIGPIVNIVCCATVLRHPSNALLLSIVRVIKGIFITFSGTVMSQAALADIASGADMAIINTRLQVAVGLAVVSGPYLESAALKVSNGNPTAPFKLMMGLSFVQLFNYIGMLPETLFQRKDWPDVRDMLASLNPFSFLKLYFGKNNVLKKLMTIQTLQFCVDGKVTSDLFQQWAKNNVGMTTDNVRDFVAFWGAAVTSGGAFVHPFLLKKLSTYTYSTVGNLFVGTGLAFHGLAEKAFFMWGGVPFLIPGVNGGSTHAIKALSMQLSAREGYGNGEFSAWANNMRALVQSIQIVVLGTWYAYCREHGLYAGTAWFLAAFVGGFLPQLLMMTMDKKDFELPDEAS